MEINQDITTPQNRTDWNGYIGNLNGNPVSDQSMNDYKATNPNFSVTPDMIPKIQQEHTDIRTGTAFGNLNSDQLNKVRTGMSDNFLKETDLSKSYYPQIKQGATDHGTDIEAYAGGDDKSKVIPPTAIPKPNYDDPNSRLEYATQFTKKYGPLMQGRGDTPLRINEVPDAGSDTAKNLSIKAASKLGLDPTLLYSSAMEEGMSGLYADKKGKVDFSGDDKYPVSGYVNFGLDNFSDKFPELVKKGYLSKDFADSFKKSVEAPKKGDNKTAVNSANFKTADAALEAKAAMIKDTQDTTESYAKENNIPLSEKQKQFFTLVAYNAGEGNMKKMIKEYSRNGYLKDDNFIDKRPSDSWKGPWENVSRRLKMADALKQEQLF